MSNANLADFGMIGMAVMGRNLSFNILDNGFTLAGYNREPEMLASAVAESGGRIVPAKTYPEFVAALKRPRRIMMMIKAGKPVDMVLGSLLEILEPDDIVIDGGNSWYQDTERRVKLAAEKGVHFFGVGVSGGEDGARHGPALMPGGDAEAYGRIQAVFEAIAAKTDAGPCVSYIGRGGSGHFVKMVHNGIEYADMQFIAEAYDLLKRAAGLDAEQLANVFDSYNKGPLESFLIELSAHIFRRRNARGGHEVDMVLDKAGQKGTGRWTARMALELGVAVPSIAAAIDARVLSSMKAERIHAEPLLTGPDSYAPIAAEAFVPVLAGALEAAKIGAYAQGMALIAAGSKHHDWGIDLRAVAGIWQGGCIIRARFLNTIIKAYTKNATLPNLMLDDGVRARLNATHPQLRQVINEGVRRGIPVGGLAASLAYYDSYRTARLPQNLTQAQRDAFGAHTYRHLDNPDGPPIHTAWLT